MIRITRKLTSRWYVIMPLCVLMLSFTTACSTNGNFVSPEAPSIDDEALVRGVFFAEGPVGDRITAYNGLRELRDETLTVEQRISIQKVQDALITNIKVNDPGFIPAFGKAMRSGDHVLIQNTLTEASAVFMESAQLYAKQRSLELSDLQSQLDEYRSSDLAPADWSKENLEQLIKQKKSEIAASSFATEVAKDDAIIDVYVETDVVVVLYVLIAIAVADIVLLIANPGEESSELKSELLIQNIVTDLELQPADK